MDRYTNFYVEFDVQVFLAMKIDVTSLARGVFGFVLVNLLPLDLFHILHRSQYSSLGIFCLTSIFIFPPIVLLRVVLVLQCSPLKESKMYGFPFHSNIVSFSDYFLFGITLGPFD